MKTAYPTPGNGSVSSTTDYEQLTYDAASRLIQDRRRDGQVVTYSYDLLSRVTAKSLPATTYAYDNLDRITSTTYNGQTLSMAYDALNRLTRQTGSLGAVQYQYDLAGERTRMSWPDGFYITYSYDYAGDLSSILENPDANSTQLLASYSYDALGRRIGVARGNGVSSTYGWDGASRLSSLTQAPAGTWSFGYNAAGQAVTRSAPSAYVFSGQTALNRPYTLNGQNQVTASGALNLTYDGRGNLSSDGVTGYSYDVANRLISTSTGASLSYDALGRLAQTTSSTGVATQFLYDGGEIIGEYSASGAVLQRYVFGPGDDEPLVWYAGSGVSNRSWLLADHQGSVVATTNSAGAVVASNTYDEDGVPGASNAGRFQYTGQAWIPEVGLYDYKARLYSPTLGRFMQSDPIGYGDGMNMYNYVHSDGVNGRDPSGMGADSATLPVTLGGNAYGVTIPNVNPALPAPDQSGTSSLPDETVYGHRLPAGCSGDATACTTNDNGGYDGYTPQVGDPNQLGGGGGGAPRLPQTSAAPPAPHSTCPSTTSFWAKVANGADTVSLVSGSAAVGLGVTGLFLAPTGAGLAAFELTALTAEALSTGASVVGAVAHFANGDTAGGLGDFAGLAGGALVGKALGSTIASSRRIYGLTAPQSRWVRVASNGAGTAIGAEYGLYHCQ